MALVGGAAGLATPVFTAPQFQSRRHPSLAIAIVCGDHGLAKPSGCGGHPRPATTCRFRGSSPPPGCHAGAGPLGAFALCLSAITAPAICMGPRRTPTARRYTAAVCGALYAIGLFGAAVTGLLTAFPKELVVAIAGLACWAPLATGWRLRCGTKTTASRAHHLSGHPQRRGRLLGVGSAFWGVVAGAIALFVQQYRRTSGARTLGHRNHEHPLCRRPPAIFKIYKDTTFRDDARGAAAGHRVAACEPRHLVWRSAMGAFHGTQHPLTGADDEWFRESSGR